MLYVLIVFLPLAAAFIAGFFGRWIGDKGAQYLTSGAVTISALLSLVAFKQIALDQTVEHIEIFDWIVSGGFDVTWAFQIDALTAVMLVVVTGISALVHWYSIGYMDHDPHIPRFMAYLSMFTFAMLMLVTADNFIQLFFGWEGVGLSSYLLIGFWYHKPSANAAAIKAFVVNRVGDFTRSRRTACSTPVDDQAADAGRGGCCLCPQFGRVGGRRKANHRKDDPPGRVGCRGGVRRRQA